MLGLLPGFGHLGRPPEESKGVSVAPARHPCQLLTSVPEPTPTLDRDPPQSLHGRCSGRRGSW